MATSSLKNTELSFTDTSATIGKVTYSTGTFTVDKPTSFAGGISSTSITISDSGGFEVAGMSDVKLAGSTSGELTLKASATTTDHTLTFPSAQGSADTFLKNDGSGGLTWDTLSTVKLSDTNISSLIDGQVLTYDAGSNVWSNQSIPAQGLNDITDVNITALIDQQQLKYDSTTSKWINFTPSGGGATGDYVFSGADITLTGQSNPVLSSAQYQNNINRNELIATCNKFTIKTEAVPTGHIEMVESGSSYFIDMTNRGAPATSSTLGMRNYNPNAWCRMQVNSTGGGGISLEGSQFIVQNNGLRYYVSPTNLHVWNSTINTAEEAYRWQVNGSSVTPLQIFGDGKIKTPLLTALSDVQTDGSSFLTTVSDERLKRDIVIVPPTEYGLAQIEQINPIRYNFISDPVGKPATVGFSAQNILASGITEGAPLNDDGFYSINSRAIMAALVNAVKQLSAEVELLKSK